MATVRQPILGPDDKVVQSQLPNHLTTAAITEAAQDAVAAMLAAGTGVTLSYNDAGNALTITGTAGSGGLDAEAVRDAIGVAMIGAGLITVTVNDAADTITISTTATANATDAALRDRTTHTGVQPSASISDLAETVQDIVGAMILAGSNVTKTYDDASGTLTLSATGGGVGGGTDPEAVRDLVGSVLVAGARITITPDDAADTVTIATTATTNSTDAQLRDRATHSGTQAASTISDFAEVTRDTIGTALEGGTGITVTVDDPGDKITVSKAGATDAQLRDRSTHTGAQAISTITGLAEALAAGFIGVAGVPPNSLGSDGQYAFDVNTNAVYVKGAGAWAPTGTVLQGPKGDTGPAGKATKNAYVFMEGEVASGVSLLRKTIWEPHYFRGLSADVVVAPSARIQIDVNANGISPYATASERPEVLPGQNSAALKPPSAGREGPYPSGTSWQFAVTDSGAGSGVSTPPTLLGYREDSSGASSTVNFTVPTTGFTIPGGGTLSAIPAGALIRVWAVCGQIITPPSGAGWTSVAAAGTACQGCLAERVASGTSADAAVFAVGDGTAGQSSPTVWITEIWSNFGVRVTPVTAASGVTESTSYATPVLTSDSAEEAASWYVGGRVAPNATPSAVTVTNVAPTVVTGTTETGDHATVRTGTTQPNFFAAGYAKSLPTSGAGGGALTATITTSPAGSSARWVAAIARIKANPAGGTAGEDLLLDMLYEPIPDDLVAGGD